MLDRAYGDVPDSPLCRIGSVTKSFTAATVYALHDADLLSVDDTVGQWLPVVQEAVGDGPTLRQLMTHHGGLSEPAFNPWVKPPQWDDLKPLMRAELREEVPGGERERYSNTGYMLLAATIEAASGLSYEDAVRQYLLDPLSLEETGIVVVEDDRLIDGRIATPIGLVRAQSALPRLMPYDGRYPIGGQGAFVSSPMDLALWARGLADGVVLTDASRAELVRPAPDSDMAAGWVREGDWVWHNGALEPLGIYAYVRWSLDDDVVVAVCGSPSVMSTSPELRVPIEQSLAGEPTDPVTVFSGPLGGVAMVSTLCLHWAIGLIGGLIALLGTSKLARASTMAWGAAMGLIGFGLTHVGLGIVAAVVVLVVGGLRWRRAQETAVGGLPAIVALVVGVMAFIASVVVVLLLAGMTFLTENLWVLMASGSA